MKGMCAAGLPVCGACSLERDKAEGKEVTGEGVFKVWWYESTSGQRILEEGSWTFLMVMRST